MQPWRLRSESEIIIGPNLNPETCLHRGLRNIVRNLGKLLAVEYQVTDPQDRSNTVAIKARIETSCMIRHRITRFLLTLASQSVLVYARPRAIAVLHRRTEELIKTVGLLVEQRMSAINIININTAVLYCESTSRFSAANVNRPARNTLFISSWTTLVKMGDVRNAEELKYGMLWYSRV